jgi:hypothetical protein
MTTMKKFLFVVGIAALCATPVAAAPPTVTLRAAPTIVAYGGSTALSGVLSTAKAGQNVDVQAQECGQTAYKKLTAVATTTGGNFSASVKPTINTNYQAKQKSATSTAVAVKVAPLLSLKKNGGTTTRKFAVTLTAAQSFVGKYVVFQRRTKTKWRSIKKVTLALVAASTPPTQLTSAKFALRLKGHPRVRVVLPAAQAGTCYLAAKSGAIHS